MLGAAGRLFDIGGAAEKADAVADIPAGVGAKRVEPKAASAATPLGPSSGWPKPRRRSAVPPRWVMSATRSVASWSSEAETEVTVVVPSRARSRRIEPGQRRVDATGRRGGEA